MIQTIQNDESLTRFSSSSTSTIIGYPSTAIFQQNASNTNCLTIAFMSYDLPIAINNAQQMNSKTTAMWVNQPWRRSAHFQSWRMVHALRTYYTALYVKPHLCLTDRLYDFFYFKLAGSILRTPLWLFGTVYITPELVITPPSNLSRQSRRGDGNVQVVTSGSSASSLLQSILSRV